MLWTSLWEHIHDTKDPIVDLKVPEKVFYAMQPIFRIAQ